MSTDLRPSTEGLGAAADLRFIDADGHLLEPPTALLRFAPPEFRDRIWQVRKEADGIEWLTLEDLRMEAAVMALAGAGGFDEATRVKAHTGQLGYTDLPDYCWDARARLDALDDDGISQSVLYPTMLLTFQHLRTLEFAEVQCRAYNDWLSELCVDGRGRLHGAAVLPQLDPVRAAAEIRRVARLPGIVGVLVRPNPAVDGKPLNHPVYDPIWQAATDVGLPIGFHPLAAADLPGAVKGLGLARLGTSELAVQDQDDYGSDNIFFAQAIGSPVDMMTTVTFMTAGGVLDRFPELRVMFLEANGGWIVPWLERLDHHYEVYGWDVPWLKEPPSAIFRRQCWISFDPDESTLAFTARSPLVGPDRIVWASDFPHPDAKYPGTTKLLAEALGELPPADQALIAGGNAATFYGLDLTA
jgi:predicted TIM-barrel fold metal-dependent hydrolase